MWRVLAFFAAEFLEFEPLGAARFLLRAVIAGAADGAFKPDVFAHGKTFMPLAA